MNTVVDENSHTSIDDNSLYDGQSHSEDDKSEIELDSTSHSYHFDVNEHSYKVDDNQLGSYINDWMEQSDHLFLKRKKHIINSFENKGPLGLFHLFMSPSFFENVIQWTNVNLSNKGKTEMTMKEFNAYVGLELAMSITNNNSIHEYWSNKPFVSVKGFQDVMSRTRFQNIRGSLQFRPNGIDTHSIKHKDPLWHSRSIINELVTNCMSTAISSGVITLDEASVRTKAKCRAKTYIPSKPDKYAIRFYALNCWKTLYLQNFFDNGAGYKGDLNCSERYVQIFPKLRTLLNNSIDTASIDQTLYGMEKDKQSWLWSLQMTHVSNEHQSKHKRRLLVTDNYYTRPSLSRMVKVMSDGEIRTLGTCRLSYVGIPNRKNLEHGISILKKDKRGSWLLVADYAYHHDHFKLKKKHDAEMNKRPKNKRTKFVPPIGDIIPNAGFIIYMDKQPVIIHTNDLKFTMKTTFMYSDNQLTIDCVHGLVPLRRWTKSRNMFREEFLAPALFVAYNIFMNGVDRMDQIRVVNPSRRREKKLVMTIFTWALDLSCNNAYSVYKSMHPKEICSMKTFKYNIIMSLIGESISALPKNNPPSLERHLLLRNRNDGRLDCCICKRLKRKRMKSLYSCTVCKKGFHVNCYSAYHNHDILSVNELVHEQVSSTVYTIPLQRAKKSKYIMSIDEFTLGNT